MTSPFDHSAIDEVIHGRLRLGIMAYVSAVASASFLEIKNAVKATDGNLSVHLSKLESAGYVCIKKGFHGKKTFTDVSLTDLGRESWIIYLKNLELLVAAANKAEAQ
jgi:DNA-binding MarR family transcriptional regulator